MSVESMSLRLRVYVAAFLLTVAACPAASGTQSGSGRLKGAVVDRQYARVLGTTIVFEAGSFKKTVEVNGDGEYDVELPAGTYLIRVKNEGFRQRRVRFEVEPGATRSLSFMLDVKPTVADCPRGGICL